jgi:hypothetical protein
MQAIDNNGKNGWLWKLWSIRAYKMLF